MRPSSDDDDLYQPVAEPHIFDYDTFDAQGVKIVPFKMDHGICDTAGFRVGNFVFTDVVELDDNAFRNCRASTRGSSTACARNHPTRAFDRALADRPVKPEQTCSRI